jgi:hypothetical protein
VAPLAALVLSVSPAVAQVPPPDPAPTPAPDPVPPPPPAPAPPPPPVTPSPPAPPAVSPPAPAESASPPAKAPARDRAAQRQRRLQVLARERAQARLRDRARAVAATRALARHLEASANASVPSHSLRASPVTASALSPTRPVAALATMLGLAGLGLAALLVSLVPGRMYLRAGSAVESRVVADVAYRLASSRGEVALLGIAMLAVLGIALLLVAP